MTAEQILAKTRGRVSTYLKGDTLRAIVAVADPVRIIMGISIQRDYPLTLIERSYGIPFGRFRSDAVRLVSDTDELHGYKWSAITHEAVFAADAATEQRLKEGKERRVTIELSTGLGNVLQNVRSLAYVDRTAYMVVGERPDHPPPYACLVQYTDHVSQKRPVGVELLLFNELGGCQRVDKYEYLKMPVVATENAKAFDNSVRWAVSGYPLLLGGKPVSLEMTTRNVSDYRHIWRLPKLEKSLLSELRQMSKDEQTGENIEFYFGFDEIRERRNFVLATREEVVVFPMELTMTEEWRETMCTVCRISEQQLKKVKGYNASRVAIQFNSQLLKLDFESTGYTEVARKNDVKRPGQFFIDRDRHEIAVKLLPAVYPHHIVGVARDGHVANISICGQSGRSGITIEDAKLLCADCGLSDALIFDNGNDVFGRVKGGQVIAHKKNGRQTRLTAALHFASKLDPGPEGGFELVSGEIDVSSGQHGVLGRQTTHVQRKTAKAPST